jgi:hypothetical protein
LGQIGPAITGKNLGSRLEKAFILLERYDTGLKQA